MCLLLKIPLWVWIYQSPYMCGRPFETTMSFFLQLHVVNLQEVLVSNNTTWNRKERKKAQCTYYYRKQTWVSWLVFENKKRTDWFLWQCPLPFIGLIGLLLFLPQWRIRGLLSCNLLWRTQSSRCSWKQFYDGSYHCLLSTMVINHPTTAVNHQWLSIVVKVMVWVRVSIWWHNTSSTQELLTLTA